MAKWIRWGSGAGGSSGVGGIAPPLHSLAVRCGSALHETVGQASSSSLTFFFPDHSPWPIANAQPVRSELGKLIATYAVRLEDRKLASSRILKEGEQANENERVWYAYAESNPPNEYMGDQPYADLLNEKMTNRFVELTHEVYKKHVGDEFGKTIPSMFTDEPQICPSSTLNTSDGEGEVFLPWTPGILDSIKAAKGIDLLERLPYIVWDKEGDDGWTRTAFLDHVQELFATNYIGVLAKWCKANNLLCTGHMNAVSRDTLQ